MSGLFGILVIGLGAALFINITNPLLKSLHGTIAELQEALNKVKLLSGLLPICASCKKVRDDKGYWNQIETYVQKHSEADFSHSICPDCFKEIYPDLTYDNRQR